MSALPKAVLAPLSAALRSFEAQWRARAPDALTAMRAEAMQRLLRLGLPTPREESWRYTNLRQLLSRSFAAAPRSTGEPLAPTASVSLLGVDSRAATVLLINGRPVLPDSIDENFNGIEITSLNDLARSDPELLSGHFGPSSDADEARWELVNRALFDDGLHLKVTTAVATPLVILHVSAADGADQASFPRVIIDLSANVGATIIEHFVEQGSNPPLCNSATQVVLGKGSKLEHYRVFATGSAGEHIDSLDVRQQADSHLRQFTIALGGGLVRTSLASDLQAPGAAVDAYSLLVGHDARHVDCVNVVVHGARDTRSRQTARAIASGTSRVVFNSKVVVSAGAVGSDSRQSSRGLLLSPSAEIDSRPQLEIHADDVKCAHGATTGRLDPDMLFYLLSRGIDRETAQCLLVYAFLADVLADMSVPSAREAVQEALIAQLPDSQILKNFR